MMNQKNHIIKYIVFDFISASMSWTCLYFYRKRYIEKILYKDLFSDSFDKTYFLAIFFISIFWIVIYYLFGYYNNIYKKSRLQDVFITFLQTLFGCVILFFIFILDDTIYSYTDYYNSFVLLFIVHSFITLFFRLILITNTLQKIRNRKIGFNTIIVGNTENVNELYSEFEEEKKSSGYIVKGYVRLQNEKRKHFDRDLITCLGTFDEIYEIIKSNKIEEVILAIKSTEHKKIEKIITSLEDCSVKIKAIPDMYDILSGQVKINNILGAPLINISNEIIPTWQAVMKRLIDISVSFLILFIMFPVFLIISLIIKLTSKGNIFYKQERIGKNKKPFKIIKFRSMYKNSENGVPQLSSKNDSRITPLGVFLRKYRLDEIPQFYNVLKGDMSLVGPRPEREFFINQIIKKASHYKYLHKVRPGITSWGQVKYGYAENVDQMIKRLKFDILYIENMSLILDFKILIYTVIIVLKGKGK